MTLYLSDITVDGACHLIFFCPDQGLVVVKAKTVYLDGTLKTVKAICTILFSVHSFIKSNSSDDVKQVSLEFVFMSRKTSSDYKVVLNHLKDKIP